MTEQTPTTDEPQRWTTIRRRTFPTGGDGKNAQGGHVTLIEEDGQRLVLLGASDEHTIDQARELHAALGEVLEAATAEGSEEPEAQTHVGVLHCVRGVRGREAFAEFLRDVAPGLALLAEDELAGGPAEWLAHDLVHIVEAAADALEGHEVELVAEDDQDVDPADLVALLGADAPDSGSAPERAWARQAIARRLGEILARTSELQSATTEREVPEHVGDTVSRLREALGEDGLVSLLADFDPHGVQCLVRAFHARAGEGREAVRESLASLARRPAEVRA